MRQRHLPYTRVEEPVSIICYLPYTKPSARLQFVVDCLRIQQVQPILKKVGQDAEYWQLLHDAWDEGETFYIVEHDVAVWQGGIQELEVCEQNWCTLPTMCHGRMVSTSFGCVKFSADLIAKNPGFWDDIETTWFHLDRSFADKMGWPFIKPHMHFPPATHLNEVQWANEISTRYALERKLVWQAVEEGEQVARVNYRVTGDEKPPWWHRGRNRGVHVQTASLGDPSVKKTPYGSSR